MFFSEKIKYIYMLFLLEILKGQKNEKEIILDINIWDWTNIITIV